MQRRHRLFPLAGILSVAGVSNICLAALLGVLIGLPVITYNGTGALHYFSGSNSFNIDGSPLAIRFSLSSPPRFINPTGVPPVEVVTVRVQVSNAGALLGGVAGDDLVVQGELDADGNGSIDYAGVLLTGEVSEFGYLDASATQDQYDLRFSVTGGLLASFFAGKDIGLTVTSENSTFANNFTVDFQGGAKGNIGPIDKRNQPPICSANGPYEAECAGGITMIMLDGTQSSDPDMDALTYSWTTDCPSATFDDASREAPNLLIDTSNGCAVDCTVTLTVSDGRDSSAPCVAQVTIRDTNAPSVSCAQAEVTLSCSGPTHTDPPTIHDDCDPDPHVASSDTVAPGDCPQELVITRTWTATDRCDNAATCRQTIHVIDDIRPLLECPQDATVSCGQSTAPSNTGQASASDNCDPAPAVTFTDAAIGGACPAAAVIERTWRAADACGNTITCVQRITVTDSTAPTLECPPDVTISCDESTSPSRTGLATAVDACDPNPAVSYVDSVSGTCPTLIERTWTATDACGNSQSCVQRITVQDIVPPTLVCPAGKSLRCGESTSPTSTGRATANDNCDPNPVVTYSDSVSGTCPQTITRTWTATDRCGLSVSCTQIINLIPAVPCPRTPGYWKNHPQAWPVTSLTVGCVTYNSTQLMNLLSNKLPNGGNASSDLSTLLAKFVIAATFNLMTGSDPQGIQSFITDSHAFLCAYPPGSNPKGVNKQNGTELKDRLDAYCNSTPAGCIDD